MLAEYTQGVHLSAKVCTGRSILFLINSQLLAITVFEDEWLTTG